MTPILEGIKYGFILVIMVGPSFFYLIRVSLMKGFSYGVAFALGILLTDFFFVFAIFFGLSKLFQNIDFQIYASLIGGIVLLFTGIQYLRSSKQHQAQLNDNPETATLHLGWLGYTLKGILINGLNPFTIMLWVGILASVMTQKKYATEEFSAFAIGVLGTVITADVLKAFLANRIANILNERLLRLADRVLGIIFMLLSIRFFYFFVQHLQEGSLHF